MTKFASTEVRIPLYDRSWDSLEDVDRSTHLTQQADMQAGSNPVPAPSNLQIKDGGQR